MARQFILDISERYAYERAMSAAEFCEYWSEARFWADEHIGECEAQYRSECALFGDAGPGQWSQLVGMKEDYARCELRYAELIAQLRDDAAVAAFERAESAPSLR